MAWLTWLAYLHSWYLWAVRSEAEEALKEDRCVPQGTE